MSQINIRNLSNENDDGSPEIVGVSTFSATSFFVPPKGSTAERPSDCEPGSIRFNTDTANLEYFRGDTIGWSQFELVNPNLGGGTGSNTGVGVRALFGGGYPAIDVIDFVTISTLGDAQDFGNLTAGRLSLFSASSRVRGVFGGGGTPTVVNTMDFVTFASTGDASDFGDVTSGRSQSVGTGSQTRGLVGAGGLNPGYTNAISYITFSQTGNSVDYGDLNYSGSNGVLGVSACSSSTRALFAGGAFGPGSGSSTNTIEFSTISSLGNTVDFGDLSIKLASGSGLSNSTRGIFVWGTDADASPSAYVNTIEFVTIATTGNSQDFGDTVTNHYSVFGTASSPTRGLIAGGSVQNIISTITILTTGNSTDFGDMTTGRSNFTACSNGHGGL